jgi:protocatechuate 3,4-dioxygenase beta subunit
VRENLDIAMWRTLAIAGTVLNDAGEPLANVRVQARRIVRGRALSGPTARTTDDRGAFRIFGLPPGRYRVCTQADGLLDETRADPERLVSTCFPSAIREEGAGVVTLSDADVPDLQIRVQQARTVRLSGTVLDATGGPAAQATVNVESRDRLDRFSGNVTVRDGRFTVEGLLPGEYRLLAYAEGPDSSDFRSGQLGLATVNVDSDSDAVVLMMARAARVAGHVVFEDAPIPRMNGRPTVRAAFAPGGVSPQPAPVRADLTFEIQGLFGPQLLDMTNLPPEWMLKSVRYNGADITDVPVTFTTSGDPRALQIAVTNRGPVVSGRVFDANGQPFGDARIFLFPADGERRRRGGADAQAGDDGSFSLGRQRAGEYLVVAVHDEDVRFDDRPDFDLLAKVAERVTLHEAEQRSLALRLIRLREDR